MCTGTKVETSRGTGRTVHEETARQRRKERKEGARAFFERGSSRLHFRLLTRFSRFQDRPVLSGPFISRLIIICILRQLARNRLDSHLRNTTSFVSSKVSFPSLRSPRRKPRITNLRRREQDRPFLDFHYSMILCSISIAAVKGSSSGIYCRLNFNLEIIANWVVYINFKKAGAALSWKIGFPKN